MPAMPKCSDSTKTKLSNNDFIRVTKNDIAIG